MIRLRSVLPILFCALLAPLHARGEVLRLDAQMDHRYYPFGITDEIFVETTLVTDPEAVGPDSRARNLCFLVDCSGSMTKEDLQAVRKGLALALAQLADTDIVSIVGFGSEVETLLSAQKVAEIGNLDDVLLRLAGEGGSSLFDGLGQAAAQIRRHATSDTIDEILLLADGPPTKGPREFEDFRALVTQFHRESIAVTTLGLGNDFDEDLLSEMARLSGGEFQFVPEVAQLPSALADLSEPKEGIVAENVVVTVTFHRNARAVKGYGWREAEEEPPVLRWHLPRVYAGQEIKLLGSVELPSYTTSWRYVEKFVQVDLAYTTPGDSLRQSDSRILEGRFTDYYEQVEVSINETVYRSIVDAVITDALQEAIEAMDEDEISRAERILRRARRKIVSWNYELDDPEIENRLTTLTTYLNEVKERGLNPFDRKILRSGLFRLVDPPSPESEEDED